MNENNLSERVDLLFQRWNRPDSPGCAVGILKDGEFVYEKYFGMANLEWDAPITAHTRFLIASMTKQFTAASIHWLALRGKLNLDDEIQRYLPEFPVYPWPITLRHLLHHTSGLREQGVLWYLSGKPLETLDNPALLALLSRQQGLNYPPGSAVAYSNSGYTLLAEMIQRVSGQSLRQFFQENIFTPLGMGDTLLDDDSSAVVKNRAASYLPRPGGGFAQQFKTYNMVGADGILSTVRDLARWDENFNRPTIGGSAWIEQLLRRGGLNDGSAIHFASGLSHASYRGLEIVRHGGMMLGFRSQMIRFPRQHFTVIILSNNNPFNPTRLIEQIADLYLAEQFTEIHPALSPQRPTEEEIREQSGVYYDAESGSVARLFYRAGMVWLEVLGNAAPVLPVEGKAYTGDQVFYRCVDGPPLTLELRLERAAPGQPYQLHVQAEMHTLPVTTQLTAEAVDAQTPDGYAGDYYSAELDCVYHFDRTPGGLRGGLVNGPLGALQPGPPGTMFFQDFTLAFDLNASGTANGFTLLSPRARGIRFTRQE